VTSKGGKVRKRVFEFTDFNEFYQFYKPLTPYGQTHKAHMEVFHDEDIISRMLDLSDEALVFIQIDNTIADRVEYHLKNIPRLPGQSDSSDMADLFLYKRFLINFRAICRLISPDLAELMNLRFNSPDLLAELCRGGSDETFHLADCYSPELGEVRSEIRLIESKLKNLREDRINQIIVATGHDFTFNDFLVVQEGPELTMNSSLIYMEPHDRSHLIIKPVLGDEYYAIMMQREALARKESDAESEVLESLSAMIRNEEAALSNYVKAVETLDIHLARARTALEFDMTRPLIAPRGSNISVEQGRFIPQILKCSAMKTSYQPLTVSFANPIIVIHGSNMGGKTVLLKTIGFLQLLTQMGFHVPADEYRAPLFRNIHHIGETGQDYLQGLSSFGLEIFNFMNTWNSGENSDSRLYLIDEFARTTGSREATALIQAILSRFSEIGGIHCFMSTHFMELNPIESTSFYKMKGLNHTSFQEYFEKTFHGNSNDKLDDMSERIRTINRFMEFEVLPDTDRSVTSDALKIAAILGLDAETLNHAWKHLEKSS
jgi:DNA mismatch repair ATPase MutS